MLAVRCGVKSGGGVEALKHVVGGIAALFDVDTSDRNLAILGGTAFLFMQFTRDGEHCVANLLCAETAWRIAPQETVVGIGEGFNVGRFAASSLAVGSAMEDEAVQAFHFPTPFDEADGEPVE